MGMRIFLSYHFGDANDLVRRVAYYLRKQPGIAEVFFFQPGGPPSRKDLAAAIDKCDALVVFRSGRGETQEQEIDAFLNRQGGPCLWVVMEGFERDTLDHFRGSAGKDLIRVQPAGTESERALACAEAIIKGLEREWVVDDDVPPDYVFAYEKDLIRNYTDLGNQQVTEKLIDNGCPDSWPEVEWVPWKETAPSRENPLHEDRIGAFRAEHARVVVDAREAILDEANDETSARHLTFPEAGPRRTLAFPKEGDTHLTIGIVVSGGIAPGINAVIEGIVARHTLYTAESAKKRAGRYTLEIRGYVEGMSGLLGQGDNVRAYDLNESTVRQHAYLGGSLLRTARADEFLDPDPARRDRYMRTVLDTLRVDGIDILYVIGGDGSMRAAHAIWARARSLGNDLSVVAIPKTMDNDILWVWQAFGFLSAVDKATEVIRHLHTEVMSNPRLCVIQLFGSDSGFVVSHAGLASGIGMCDAVLIPEVAFSMKVLSKYILGKLTSRHAHSGKTEERSSGVGERPFGLIALAETAIPTDVDEYLEDPEIGLTEAEKLEIRKFVENGRRVRGQTPDDLRTGGLKIVSRVLEREIRRSGEPRSYWEKFRVFTNEPRHLLRALPPSVSDVTFGQRLGTLAVDNAMAGYTDFMVSQWLTEYVLVPLRAVIVGRKRVPTDGIFWKSVLAATGQPAELSSRSRPRSQ